MNTTENSAAKYVIREYVTNLCRFNDAVFEYDKHEKSEEHLELLRFNLIEGFNAEVEEDIENGKTIERDKKLFAHYELVSAAKRFVSAANQLEEYTGIKANKSLYKRAFTIASYYA